METAHVNLPDDDTRFRVELQFVQLLSDPHYIIELVKNGYFNDQSFVNYLKYLKYWGTPEYIKYIKFPICLYFLDLLTSDDNYYKKFQNDNTIRPILDETINFTMRSLYNYRGWAEKSFAEAKKQELEELEQQQQQPPQLPPPTQQQQL